MSYYDEQMKYLEERKVVALESIAESLSILANRSIPITDINVSLDDLLKPSCEPKPVEEPPINQAGFSLNPDIFHTCNEYVNGSKIAITIDERNVSDVLKNIKEGDMFVIKPDSPIYKVVDVSSVFLCKEAINTFRIIGEKL